MSLTATPTRRLLATTAMLLLVLSAAVSVHAAEVVITAGTCKPTTAAAADIGPCIAGSVLTLTGTDIPADATVVIGRNEAEQALIRCVSPTLTATSLTCTIETEKSAVFGEYPITLTGGISAGNIVYGKFPQQSIAGWNTHKLNDRDIVSFYSSDWPSTGDEWLIYGTFDTTKTYKVLFYSDDVLAIADMRTPTCSITTDSVLPYAISCKISVEMGVMGMWGFLVQEGTDGPFIPTSSSVKLIAVNPNLPTATSASGDCAGNSNKCVTGATLTITGTNFNTRDASFNLVSIGTDGKITCTPTKVTATELTCKLTVPSDATVGENAISVRLIVCSHMMKSPSVPLGHLFVGQFPQLTFPGWTKEAHVSGNSLVTSFNSDWPSTGDDWIIYGTFDTTKTYKVLFYSDDPLAIADMRTPTCASITTTANTITCQITIESGVMGMWNFLVREGDDGSCLPGSTSLFKIAVNPKLPTFDVASGACAGESSKCVTGATLTIAGTNFNTRDASYNLVSIGTDGKITCTPKTVTTTALTCELAIPDDAAAGPHAITVRLVVCSHMMKSPSVPLGYMVLGVGSAPGWTPINEHVKISSMAPESVTVGGELSFIGTFETAATYTVSFESVAAASSAVPQCKVTTVTATTVTFKYDGMLGVYGNWRPKLLANGFVLGMAPGTDAQTVTLEPLPPVVEDVSGDCAKDSKKCVTGAQLTFTGKGFNADAKRHRVTIDGMQDGECKVLQGTQQSIVCELTISASKSRASADDVSAYRMSLHTAVTDGNWLPTTAYIGTLMLTTGSDTIPGIVNTDAEPIIIQRITKGGGANKGLIACSVVFAVLLVAVCAGAAFVFWRYKLVKRGAEREHRDEEFWRDNDQQSIGSMPFHAVVKD